jgi:hypothetical protein
MLLKRILLPSLLFCALYTSAQDFSPMAEFATGIGSAVSQSHAMADVFRDVYGRGASDSKKIAAKKLPANATSASSQLTYLPSATETSKAIRAYVANTGLGGEAAVKAQQALEKANVPQRYRLLVTNAGLRDDNVSDAFTAYTVLGWMIANNAAEPSRAVVQGTRNKFAQQLAANPSLSGSHAAIISEKLKLLFVIMDDGWQDAKRKGKGQAYSDTINSAFNANGLNMRSLKLTTSGFAFKQRF